MSAPAPCSVHAPPLSDWLPASAGAPMSAQVHWLGHDGGGGGGGGELLSATVSMVTVLTAVALWEVTARPAIGLVPRLTPVVEPAIGDHVFPAADTSAVNEPGESATCRYAGTVPAASAT